MSEHVQKIDDVGRAETLLESMTVTKPAGRLSPIGVKAEVAKRIDSAWDVLMFSKESRRLLEESRQALAAMQYASAKSRQMNEQARSMVFPVFGDTAVAFAVQEELSSIRSQLDEIPMPTTELQPKPVR